MIIVVIADWLFTTPTAIVHPISGCYLAHLAGFPLSSRWILWSVTLYVLAGACWLPVVWLQIPMAAMARTVDERGLTLLPTFWRYHCIWTSLGVAAFVAFLAIFYLMVVKPG